MVEEEEEDVTLTAGVLCLVCLVAYPSWDGGGLGSDGEVYGADHFQIPSS